MKVERLEEGLAGNYFLGEVPTVAIGLRVPGPAEGEIPAWEQLPSLAVVVAACAAVCHSPQSPGASGSAVSLLSRWQVPLGKPSGCLHHCSRMQVAQ